jgi:hypothetical protein
VIRTRITALGCAGYLVCAGTIVLESLVGVDPATLPAVGTAIAALGAAVLIGAGIATLAGLDRGRLLHRTAASR